MSVTAARPRPVSAADVEGWLRDLALEPGRATERDGLVAWDLELDGRRRFDVPITLILDPSLAVIVWVHFAPPIGDGLRKAYRTLLRWNDEFPFAKFSLAEDGRPILMAELPIETVDRDVLGVALARLLLICDRLLEDAAGWLWIGGRIPDQGDRRTRNPALFARYADRLGELVAS
jgi:Putative bacterial sensory transduction regulator